MPKSTKPSTKKSSKVVIIPRSKLPKKAVLIKPKPFKPTGKGGRYVTKNKPKKLA